MQLTRPSARVKVTEFIVLSGPVTSAQIGVPRHRASASTSRGKTEAPHRFLALEELGHRFGRVRNYGRKAHLVADGSMSFRESANDKLLLGLGFNFLPVLRSLTN
jgi:hypothetical protein